MVYNDTDTKLGLLQSCEVKLFGDQSYGTITSDTNLKYQFAGRINRAQDRFNFLAATADGRWEYEDDNNTDMSIATTNIVSGQQDYTLAVTHLEIEKVLILPSATSTQYQVIYPIDKDDPEAIGYLENDSSDTGVPSSYDKRGESLIFDITPNYSASLGLKIYFKRGPSYFLYSDTTAVPGFASIFHDYLALHASRGYAVDRSLAIAKSLDELVAREEGAITEFFSKRSKDEVTILRNEPIIYE